MAAQRFNSGFLKSRAAKILTLVLVSQAVVLYAFTRKEIVPNIAPLSTLPGQVGAWVLHNEGTIDQETQDVLKADDLLTRTYVNGNVGGAAHLFIAFFKTQRSGQAPHSPKNCLPGSGWVPSVADTVAVPIPNRPQPITINRYIVQKGDSKSLVLYWYQSRDRIVASEYTAKFYVVADAMRYNRTDTALVRVVVPIPGNDVKGTEERAFNFVQSIFAPLQQHLPS